MLGGGTDDTGSYINRYYHPDYDTDNDEAIECTGRPNWLNLRRGELWAAVCGLQVPTEGMTDEYNLVYFTERGEVYSCVCSPGDFEMGLPRIVGRLHSPRFVWTAGTIESLTHLYLRVRGRRVA